MLRQLKYFQSVVRLNSFSEAAGMVCASRRYPLQSALG